MSTTPPAGLAQEITETVVDAPLDQRVLDPSCGSGTFIETTVNRILNHAGKLSATEKLRKLQENVVGIDIHPVAVQLAKATWVMAAAKTIRAARKEDPDSGTVSAPIYLGDSMQLRYDTGTLTASQSIELESRETLPGQLGPITFSIPKELARQQTEIDQLISEMATNIDEGQDPERVADNYQMTDESRQSITAVAALMKELHAAGRNHVWAYYIRNMIRPAVIAEQKVDRIIGNPPWLTYGQSADIIRQELRDMSENRYRIWAGGKLAPHQDIATLFYTRCAELYAKPQTIIGMVMPHSALRDRTASEMERRQLQANRRTQCAQHRTELPGPRTLGPGQRGTGLLPNARQRGLRSVHRCWPRHRTGASNRAGVARQLGRELSQHHQDE